RDETARFVAVEQLSFSFGDKLSFQNWLPSSANPTIRRIPRNTLKRTIHKLVATQKKELIKEFASLDNKVSLCSDIWIDHWQSCSYMGIICHWIDNAWNIQKRLLAYRCFNDPHTAQNISHLMFIILEEYGLTSKFSTTEDEDTFDILRWWAQKKQVYPILSLMAKEILACPVSTVAVEQAFSMGGNTLDERRSTIRPENLEAQYLLNDWSRAASRTQDQDETNDDEDTEGISGTTTGGGGTSECD
ncbi:hypothetical protein F511_32887, partial [Dorcoceras hygrometricum]